MFIFQNTIVREVVRVFQIREHHAKIVKLGRYNLGSKKLLFGNSVLKVIS